MTTYRAAVNAKAGANTANTILFQLKAGATYRPRLSEIILTVTTAPTNAPQIAIMRSATVGTASTTMTGQAADPAEGAGTAALESAWSSAPTISGTNYLFATTLPTTAGSILYWSAPTETDHIVLSTSTGLSFVQVAASGTTVGAYSLQLAWEE